MAVEARAWITGEYPNQKINFELPSGPKGDPGGWVTTFVPQTTDPDTLTATGIYAFESLTTHINKIPPGYQAGVIETLNRRTYNDRTWQRLTPNGTQNARVFFERFGSAGTWTEWQAFGSVHVDNSVGSRVFLFDGTTDHMVSGSTGWRDVSGLLVNGWTAVTLLRIKREGSRVSLIHRGLSGVSATSGLALTIPTGFRSATTVGVEHRNSTGTGTGLITVDFAGGVYCGAGTAFSGSVAQYITWETEQPWPTTLPGTPA